MKPTMYFIIALLLGFVSASFSQTVIYKTTHKDGSVSFSDKPSIGAEEVLLKTQTNTYSTPNMTVINPVAAKPQSNTQYSLAISPVPDATIRNNVGDLKISASISPAIKGEYELTLNGELHKSQQGLFSFTNMNRGTYSYSIKFIGNSGKILASSEVRELHLHRASVLINQKPNNPS